MSFTAHVAGTIATFAWIRNTHTKRKTPQLQVVGVGAVERESPENTHAFLADNS